MTLKSVTEVNFCVVVSNDEGSNNIRCRFQKSTMHHLSKMKITELELIEGTASQIDLEVEALDKNGNIVKCNWYKDGKDYLDGKGLSGTKTPTVHHVCKSGGWRSLHLQTL